MAPIDSSSSYICICLFFQIKKKISPSHDLLFCFWMSSDVLLEIKVRSLKKYRTSLVAIQTLQVQGV